MMLADILMAATLLTAGGNGVELRIDSESKTVDPSHSVLLTVELRIARDRTAVMPDLRDRVVGFSLVDSFPEPSRTETDGTVVETERWKLVPEPAADVYKLKPFAVKASPKLLSSREDDGRFAFVAGPLYFENPPAREPVTGGMEVDPEKDLPPLTWKLAGYIALALAALAAAGYGAVRLVKLLVRKVREHRMSPIERAWVELDRLLRKGLPGRGRYKDFYVELTMVVRRYVQRRYGVRAPHLTTEEFLAEFRDASPGTRAELQKFLESADMVKFAGVQATPEMADDATDSARGYLKSDGANVRV